MLAHGVVDTAETKLSLQSFDQFVDGWIKAYKARVKQIKLFDVTLTSTLTQQQQAHFAKVFYHLRGNFHDFLWYMGNHAPDLETKQIVVNNILEEFGGKYNSHERLYYEFAEALGVDIKAEILTKAHEYDFVKQFNQGHLHWLYQNEWSSCVAAFAAYECLDNVDYTALSELIRSFGVADRGLLFFKVHEKVEHFQPMQNTLDTLWQTDADKIKKGFDFIAEHQIEMWNKLSISVFNE